MRIDVTQTVKIDLKREAFTEAFMEEFRNCHSDFYDVEEHTKHIAWLIATGLHSEVRGHDGSEQFFEGYGPIGEFVNSAVIEDTKIEEQ